MKYINARIIFIIMSFSITGCGGGGGGTTNTDPNATAFKFFPPGFFVAGYREEFNLSAIRSDAVTSTQIDTFTNNQVITTQPEGVYNLTSVIPTLDTGVIGFSNGSTTPVSNTQYYTIDSNDRRYQGDIIILFGITTTTTAITTNAIPETVKIGESGQVGTYLDNFGSSYTISWNVTDAGNSQARLTWTTRIVNSSAIDASERDDVFIIDASGNRLSKEVRFETFALSPNIIDNWIGVKVP